MEITEQIDDLITGFYINVIGPFWDNERKYIDEGYKTIPFPFKEIQVIEVRFNMPVRVGQITPALTVKKIRRITLKTLCM